MAGVFFSAGPTRARTLERLTSEVTRGSTQTRGSNSITGGSNSNRSQSLLTETLSNDEALMVDASIAEADVFVKDGVIDAIEFFAFYTGCTRAEAEHAFAMHGWGSEEHELGIPQTQVFDLFQRHRRAILKRLRERPEECAEAMEAVTRVVTFTGTRQEGQNHLERRRWVELDPLRNAGRFVIQLDREEGAAAAPSASHEAGGEDAAAAAAAAPSALAGAAAPAETYDAWLAREELGATPCLERRALTAVP